MRCKTVISGNNDNGADTEKRKDESAMELGKKKPEPMGQRTNRKHLKIKKDNLQLFSMSLPGIILLILFFYLPMFALILAFKDYKFSTGFFGSPWCGFENFEFFFTSGVLGRLLRNTVGLNLLFLICNTLITVVLALLLYEITNRIAIKMFQTIIFLPFIISWVAAAYALYANISDVNGIVNGILKMLGREPVMWYTEPKWWPYILLICYLWKNIGYGMIIYYANLLSIDKSYFEAAQLDGATRIQMMRYISLPFIQSVVTMFFILSLGRVFSADFGMFYYLTKNSSVLYSMTDVIDTYVYRALTVTGDVGMSTAIGLCQSVVGFMILLAANRIARRYSEGGAVF